MAELNVRKRGDKWEYRFEAAKIEGKRKQITKGGFQTKKIALDAGTKALFEYNNSGLNFEPTELSVSDYFDYWYENYCTINLKYTTCRKYESYIRVHLKPAIGIYRLNSLTSTVLQKFINTLFTNGYSRNTIMNVRALISGALDYAVETAHFIRINPMISVKTPSVRSENGNTRKKDHIVLTKEQMLLIFDRFPEGHSSYIPLMLGYHCGLRIGETFALTWDDIDLDTGYLDVNKQVQWHDQKWKLSQPKYNSCRKIRLDAKMIQALIAYKLKQENERIYYSDYYTTILVDNNELNIETGTPINMLCRKINGRYLQSRTLQHTNSIIHKKLGIKNYDYHSLRHTHTTMLVAAGADLKDVQHRLGHKNIKVTLDVYSHNTPEMEDRTINILDSIT